jgi:hypothetical protein
MSTTIPELYRQDQFVARKHMLRLLGASFDLKTTDGRLLAYSRQKAFRLREDIRVFADEAQTVELLYIQADRVVDWSASYHVTDSQTGEPIGAVRRKGWSSMVRDSWEILDPEGNVRAHVLEDSSWKALLRRAVDWAALFLPQTYLLQVNGQTVATMAQNFFGIPPKFHVDLTHDTNDVLPRPLAVATVILLLAIEGRQTGLT